MLSVEAARERIVGAFRPLGQERVALSEALGRVLAADVAARVTQPPVAVSAMDGYAVRAADVARVPVRLAVVGMAPAGGAFKGAVRAGEAVRIFTGGPLPAGADAVAIQENATAEGDHVTINETVAAGSYIRPAGLDFRAGEVGLKAGRRMTARDIGLAAAMNHPWLAVRRRPRVAVLATGDELVLPGEPIGASQIVSSNGPSLVAFVAACGGEAIHLGIAPDDRAALQAMATGATAVDLLVISGGASVGDHDLVRSALGERGLELDFWRVAMRPGKPLLFGRIGATPVLGVPGNPVSSLVCATLFLKPAIDAMLGVDEPARPNPTAILGRDLAENDSRQDYLRATLSHDRKGRLVATPFPQQDSSVLSRLAWADCLVVRPPHAPAADKGTTVEIVPLAGGAYSI